ncbi:MAG TPA: XTP/dITP diphosphatase [Dehalococcoidia bacterium]|nr:XTP/dITP diphosphatase [Dehalococcoidia bacterium]
MNQRLLLATNNKGKAREYETLLTGIPFQLVTMAEEGITTKVEESAETFEENARLKATTLAAESGLISLADDSGLEVDALGGEPGAKSHRYAGEDASDSDRITFLLSRMKDIPEGKRTASFRCVIALATPAGHVEFCHGECRGIITFEPRGEQNFGYDPVFYVPSLGRTMAELSLEEKNSISHRGDAARKAIEVLKRPPFSNLQKQRNDRER